jgi:hypothetical protein
MYSKDMNVMIGQLLRHCRNQWFTTNNNNKNFNTQ